MRGFNAFLAALAMALAIAVVGLAHALVQCPPYAPEIKAGQQSQTGPQTNQCASVVADASSGTETAGGDGGCGKCRAQTQHGEGEGTEFWPPIFGYRLKVTDTLLVAFTLLLALATGALWWATRKLVEGAEKTAERQLRAYVHVDTVTAKFLGDKWKLLIRIKNFGQTPARDVRWAKTSMVVDWNGGNPMLPTPGENETETLGSMGPGGDVFETEMERDPKDATTRADLTITPNPDPTAKATPAAKAIFLVGTIKYKTVFGSDDRTTDFRYYIGGDASFDFENGDGMSTARGGNEAT